MSIPKHRLIRVEWDDAATTGNWRNPSEMGREERLQCQSVGHVVRSNKQEVVLALSISESGNMSDTIAIPRGCIRKVRRLEGKA